jgi:hypothetical protein
VVAAALEPYTMTVTELFRSPPEPKFQGASTGLIADGVLWLGSWMSDRVGFVRLSLSK